MVIKVKANTPLSATPFFDVLGFKVMASWPGSEKACPRCKQVGHDSHSCPRRPAAKQSKKRSSFSKQPSQSIPTPKQSLPTSSLTAIPDVDTADMDEDSPTSDPILFPFQLTPEQAQHLNTLSAEQWVQHCQTVRTNHPRTELEIDRFLSLLIKEITQVFYTAVQHLVDYSPSFNPLTQHLTQSTSTS